MVPPLEESEEENRANFPRWGKRSVISYHFTELAHEIVDMGMPSEKRIKCPLMYTFCAEVDRNCRLKI